MTFNLRQLNWNFLKIHYLYQSNQIIDLHSLLSYKYNWNMMKAGRIEEDRKRKLNYKSLIYSFQIKYSKIWLIIPNLENIFTFPLQCNPRQPAWNQFFILSSLEWSNILIFKLLQERFMILQSPHYSYPKLFWPFCKFRWIYWLFAKKTACLSSKPICILWKRGHWASTSMTKSKK